VQRKETNNSIFKISKKDLRILSQLPVVPVPKDGNSLFWSIALVYLVELRENGFSYSGDYEIKFAWACKNLFGEICKKQVATVQHLIKKLQMTQDPSLIYAQPVFRELVIAFRERVVDYMQQHIDEFKPLINKNFFAYLQTMRLPTRFASEPEILAIVKLLGCNIKIIDLQKSAIVFYSAIDNVIAEQETECLLQVRTLVLYYKADELHYFFHLKNDDVSQEEIIDLDASASFAADVDVSSDDSYTHSVEKPINKVRIRMDGLVATPYKPTSLHVVVKGLSIGVFCETLLWILPASPMVRIFFEKELRNFSLVDFVDDPYSFYKDYQHLLFQPVVVDNFLASFLNANKPCLTGGVLGTSMGLITVAHLPLWKRFFFASIVLLILQADFFPETLYLKTSELFTFFLETVNFPTDHFSSLVKKNFSLFQYMENLQCQILALSLLPLSGIGLVHCFDIMVNYLRPTLEGLKSVTNKILEKTTRVITFFTQKATHDTTTINQQAYLQPDIRACH
jgi:hypothetical protein